jgi:phosphoribosylcarboxyaminoimidazole (NCAIR) mutase
MYNFCFLMLQSGSGRPAVMIAVAGRSNGLGPVLAGNVSCPVINCPPVKPTNVTQDVWSSLNTPSGNMKTKLVVKMLDLSTDKLVAVQIAFFQVLIYI